jgi:hypothetical protein
MFDPYPSGDLIEGICCKAGVMSQLQINSGKLGMHLVTKSV